MYSQGHGLTRLMADHPEVVPFMDRKGFGEDLDADFPQELRDPGDGLLNRVWATCVMHADFFEQALLHREMLDARDWNQWWWFFCDAYDESPALRAYLKARKHWYSVDEHLPPDKR